MRHEFSVDFLHPLPLYPTSSKADTLLLQKNITIVLKRFKKWFF